MPVLNIEGRRVRVDDAFLSLSPEDQQATVEDIAKQMGIGAGQKVDPATNQPSGVPQYVPPGVAGYDPKTGEVARQYGMPGSAAMGAADVTTLGFGDEAAAGAGYLLDRLPGGQHRDYGTILGEIRGDQRAARDENPGSYLAGQIAGALAGGTALANSGLSLSANAIKSGAGLGKTALASGIEGAVLGGIQGAGSGEDLGGRISSAGLGFGLGGALGAGVPLAVAGVQAAARPAIAALTSRFRPQPYAEQALADGLRRSGMSADDVAAVLERAKMDGQDMFTVADAMGHSGQRMLSTVARNPNDMRQTVADTLVQRQMGQGERLSNALAEGFNAPDTAAQRAASLVAQRKALADVNYEAARAVAGPVDVSNAIRAADDVLQPGVTRLANPASNIADDSIEGVVRRAQRLLTDGKSNVVDFSAALRAKQDISDMIEASVRQGKNGQARFLSQINQRLDDALERASPQYRAANDAFRAQSRTIDAVDAGRAAASGRTRAVDNIRAFEAMEPGERMAFRSGYVDPLIARVENSAIAPTTNKARPLMTDKTGQEFPAFAIPQRADKMGRRIAREQRMFETANAALGGSKTADNLADAAEMAKFDPGVMMNLFRGRPIQAAVDAVARLANEARGMPPAVMDRIAKTLLETNPEAARAMIRQAGGRAARADGRRALANAILLNMSGSAVGRLAAP